MIGMHNTMVEAKNAWNSDINCTGVINRKNDCKDDDMWLSCYDGSIWSKPGSYAWVKKTHGRLHIFGT